VFPTHEASIEGQPAGVNAPVRAFPMRLALLLGPGLRVEWLGETVETVGPEWEAASTQLKLGVNERTRQATCSRPRRLGLGEEWRGLYDLRAAGDRWRRASNSCAIAKPGAGEQGTL
jgi:hypothetical protein